MKNFLTMKKFCQQENLYKVYRISLSTEKIPGMEKFFKQGNAFKAWKNYSSVKKFLKHGNASSA